LSHAYSVQIGLSLVASGSSRCFDEAPLPGYLKAVRNDPGIFFHEPMQLIYEIKALKERNASARGGNLGSKAEIVGFGRCFCESKNHEQNRLLNQPSAIRLKPNNPNPYLCGNE